MAHLLAAYIDNADFIASSRTSNFTFNLIDKSIKLTSFMVHVHIFEIFIIWTNCFIKVHHPSLCSFSLYLCVVLIPLFGSGSGAITIFLNCIILGFFLQEKLYNKTCILDFLCFGIKLISVLLHI